MLQNEQLTNAIGDDLFLIFSREAIKANLNHYSPLKMKPNGNLPLLFVGFDTGHFQIIVSEFRAEVYSSRYFFYSEGDSVVLFRTQYFNSQVKTFIIKFIYKDNNIGIIKSINKITKFYKSINNQNNIH